MENGEIDYNELFGVQPDAGGEGAGEGTDPGQTGDGEGEADKGGADHGEQEPGAGKEITGNGEPTGGQADTGSQPLPGGTGYRAAPGKPGTADDGAFMESVIKGLGITDPYSGKPITTKAEYDAYRERIYRERRDFILSKTNMTEEELDEFARNLPEVRRAAEESAKAKALMESERRRQSMERLNAEIKKISAMDPSVKSIADLTGGDDFNQLLELVKRGYDLSDAWKLANFDKLQGKAQAASRQAAINSGAGRAGFKPTQPKGEGGDNVPVPPDVLEMYRGINPGATDAEIRAEYNKYLKQRKEK